MLFHTLRYLSKKYLSKNTDLNREFYIILKTVLSHLKNTKDYKHMSFLEMVRQNILWRNFAPNMLIIKSMKNLYIHINQAFFNASLSYNSPFLCTGFLQRIVNRMNLASHIIRLRWAMLVFWQEQSTVVKTFTFKRFSKQHTGKD